MPNITGNFCPGQGDSGDEMRFAKSKGWTNGALSFGGSGNTAVADETSNSYSGGYITFNAKSSNTIYGRGSNVLPTSRKCKYLIKY